MSLAEAVAEPPVESTAFKTGAELLAFLHAVGGVPVGRVRLHPPPGTATVADLDAANASGGLWELVDGVLIGKAMSREASHIALRLGFFLLAYLEENDLGFCMGADGQAETGGGRYRGPDVSFFTWEQNGGGRVTAGARMGMPPALAVEVLSPGNTGDEMRVKRAEYFGGGSRLVWEIDPLARTARVYTAADQSTLLSEADALDGADVLPGFALPLATLFAKLAPAG